MIAKLSVIALDCPQPRVLADFYAAITGWTDLDHDSDNWIQLSSTAGATMAFQRVEDHEPPTWPEGSRPQQMHLDFNVASLDEGEQQVLALGAIKAEVQPKPEEWLVFLDPAGHPFCLVDERFA